MTREEVYNQCKSVINTCGMLLCQLPTGYGKSKIAIDLLNYIYCNEKKNLDVLLLVAKRVHKQNWKDEIIKWKLKSNITIHMDCYESLKHHQNCKYDVLVMDECHHVQSEMRLGYLSTISFKYMIGLSATMSRELIDYMRNTYSTSIVSSTLQNAIDSDILPEPQIILLPLQLDNDKASETIELNPKVSGNIIRDEYENLWKYKYIKPKRHVILTATQKQKEQYLNTEILYFKNSYMRTYNEWIKNTWLHLCGQRLVFLANCKNDYVHCLLSKMQNKRTLTFCSSIEQSEILGKYCIHSQNGNVENTLDSFNKEKINHITAVRMLDEGINLHNCQYGIFANLNSSQRLVTQRIGRILRHKHPKIIIPYYKDSREEKIVEKMIDGYNTKLIHTYDLTQLV